MKIEKVNDNQIRCTLTREDLANRQLKLSELAYGTEKAKSLFRDMMQQAAFEFGFEAEDIPLMIEAIPLSSDCITLIITKVEYPEELDTRFSKFAPANEEDEQHEDLMDSLNVESADDVLGLFQKIHEKKRKAKETEKKQKEFIPLEEAISKTSVSSEDEKISEDILVPVNLTKLYAFHHLEEVNNLAHVLNFYYDGTNTLYKNRDLGIYYLVLHKDSHTPEEFNKVCNILSEYAQQEKYTKATEAYFQEHLDVMIRENALQVLATL